MGRGGREGRAQVSKSRGPGFNPTGAVSNLGQVRLPHVAFSLNECVYEDLHGKKYTYGAILRILFKPDRREPTAFSVSSERHWQRRVNGIATKFRTQSRPQWESNHRSSGRRSTLLLTRPPRPPKLAKKTLPNNYVGRVSTGCYVCVSNGYCARYIDLGKENLETAC